MPPGGCNNILIVVCDKLNDLPAFLYLNNPRARSIHVDLPDRQDRLRFVRRAWPGFYGSTPELGDILEAAASEFVDLTDGLTQYELRGLVRLSNREAIPVRHPATGVPNVRSIIEKFKYGVTESGWDRIDEKVGAAAGLLRQTIHPWAGRCCRTRARGDLPSALRTGGWRGPSLKSSARCALLRGSDWRRQDGNGQGPRRGAARRVRAADPI